MKFGVVLEMTAHEAELNDYLLNNLKNILDSLPVCAIIAKAPSGEIIYINQAVTDFRGEDVQHTGLTIEDYVKTWKEYSADGVELSGAEMPLGRAILNGEVIHQEEIIVELDNGARKWALASAAPVYDENGNIVAGSVTWFDISDRKMAHNQLVKKVEYDCLTQVYSRAKVLELATVKLDQNNIELRPTACLMLDIDHFKDINDQYGHDIGDKVLFHFAQLISKKIREQDLFGRIGGEEFVAILSNVDLIQAIEIANDLRLSTQGMCIPISSFHSEKTLTVTVSIGVAVSNFRQPIVETKQLLSLADKAMYNAKRNGRDRVFPAK